MVQVVQNQQIAMQPKYIEDFRKDLLANVYDVNPRFELPETLQRRENYSPESGLSEFFYTDFEGNEVDYALPEGVTFNNITGAFDVPQDVSGIASRSTLEDVQKPAISPLTPLQQQAISMGAEGIGAYEPYMQQADSAFQQGVQSLQNATGMYDPEGQVLYETITDYETIFDPETGESTIVPKTTRRPSVDAEGNFNRTSGYKDFYSPYVEDVIDEAYLDLDKQGMVDMYDINQRAVGAGAFGGSRGAVARQQLSNNIRDQKAAFGAKLRSDAFKNAQAQAMSAFENQAKRGQSAGQIFQGLGTAQAGLGQLGQTLATNDQQNLLGLGGLEQQQQQAEYDVQRQASIEKAMEPFTRFSYMSDIAQGIPSSQSAMNTGGAPAQNTLGSTVGTAMGIAQLGQLRR